MKRIYLILMTMAAILMVGCNDETPQPIQVEDQEVSLQIGISNPMATKATQDLNYLPDEDFINKLTVLLFNPTTQELVKGKTVTAQNGVSATEIGDVVVPAGTYDIVLVANHLNDILALAETQGFDCLNNNSESIISEIRGDLLMVSKIFRGVKLVPYDAKARLSYNYLLDDHSADNNDLKIYDGVKVLETQGYDYDDTNAKKVVMTRQTARIQLESIAVNFEDQWDGATFRLDSVFMVNMRGGTFLVLTEKIPTYEKIATYYRGGPGDFDPQMTYIISPSTLRNDLFLKDYTKTENGGPILLADGNTKSFITTEEEGKKPVLPESFFCYAFENHTIYGGDPATGDTRMIIAGEVILKNGTKLGQTYYQVPIKGIRDSKTVTIDRNWVYKVNVTIKGLGSDGPDLKDNYVMIQPTITVEKWKIVIQEETDPGF
ncbi:hypothetical protein M2137_002145 [Parabacteroides sp. PFB2-10]|uniref:fimbrial protein n=1 Tax=Parabacteroides sp. PFB2-10 TaxID=1742405 RepID=UPI00247398FA|nr:fimbrial protein [Parabacteroides sp. PFB2-10]MDH6313355.1 hypothetical protein [Parabacteroides sp. PFB2-10]MDL2245817.1 hypothetical protein [Parabacteroides sp. OttesenSCG-928-J18]